MRRFPLYGTLGPFTWRLLATVLAGQGLVIFLGATLARGLAHATGGTSPTAQLALGTALALLALAAAGLLRRPYGVSLGWLVQVLTWLAALVLPAMLGVGIVFTGLWLLLMAQGGRAERQLAERQAALAADAEGAADAAGAARTPGDADTDGAPDVDDPDPGGPGRDGVAPGPR